jgi:Ca2+-binding EF-hand superfamily protein
VFNLRLGETEMNRIVKAVDLGGDGKVQFTEFMAAASNKDLLLSDSNLRKAFSYFDMDQDGRIDLLDIKAALKLTPERTPLETSDYRNDLGKIYNQLQLDGQLARTPDSLSYE